MNSYIPKLTCPVFSSGHNNKPNFCGTLIHCRKLYHIGMINHRFHRRQATDDRAWTSTVKNEVVNIYTWLPLTRLKRLIFVCKCIYQHENTSILSPNIKNLSVCLSVCPSPYICMYVYVCVHVCVSVCGSTYISTMSTYIVVCKSLKQASKSFEISVFFHFHATCVHYGNALIIHLNIFCYLAVSHVKYF